MWISKRKIKKLSDSVKRLINDEDVDIREHKEGSLRILKNDIQTLASYRKEQLAVVEKERDILKDTLADISHQLKTPLTSMMIMAELIEGSPPEMQAEFVGNLKDMLEKTDWLVSSLLKMAKLDAKAVEFRPVELRSSELIEEAVKPLVIQLELADVNIKVLGDELIRCDKRWTAEALGNLIKNALEHTPVGSTITVETKKTSLGTTISVTDQGAGLKREQVAKLFRRFEGSESATGFGIGLPLALSIMKNQNGDIDVDPGGRGSGATFSLKFYK